MDNTTKDGYSVTTIEQNGPMAGEEVGRVTLIRRHGCDWWEAGSIKKARELVGNAKNQTAEEFKAAAEEAATEV